MPALLPLAACFSPKETFAYLSSSPPLSPQGLSAASLSSLSPSSGKGSMAWEAIHLLLPGLLMLQASGEEGWVGAMEDALRGRGPEERGSLH